MSTYTVGEVQSMLELLPVPAYLFDPKKLCYLAANQQFCKLLSYPLSELKELKWPHMMADDFVAPAERALATDAPDRPTVWQLRRKGGGKVTIAIRYRRIQVHDADGKRMTVYLSLVVNATGLSVSAKSYFK